MCALKRTRGTGQTSGRAVGEEVPSRFAECRRGLSHQVGVPSNAPESIRGTCPSDARQAPLRPSPWSAPARWTGSLASWSHVGRGGEGGRGGGGHAAPPIGTPTVGQHADGSVWKGGGGSLGGTQPVGPEWDSRGGPTRLGERHWGSVRGGVPAPPSPQTFFEGSKPAVARSSPCAHLSPFPLSVSTTPCPVPPELGAGASAECRQRPDC